MRENRRGGRWVTPFLVVAGLVVVVGLVGVALAIREQTARLGAIERSGKAFLAALGSRDGDGACARMTVLAQSEFAAKYKAESCSQAVETLTGRLSEAECSGLAGSYKSRFVTRDDSFGHVGVRENALQISELMLSDIKGAWLVAQVL